MEYFSHGGDIYSNPGVKLDFSVNTNPFGMPENVVNALISQVHKFEFYPDTKCNELVSKISAFENVPKDNILCGNGAADLIYRLCNVIKVKNALICSPAFSEYEKALKSNACNVIYHELREEDNFDVTEDIENKLVEDIDLLFLCNPNNPTGRLIDNNLLYNILKKASENSIKVIIDECFLDFTNGVSAKKYLSEFPQLVILKAFTKTYAMAGLRLGYVLTADTTLLNKLNDVSQCWSVSQPAQIAGIAALECADIIEKTKTYINSECEYFCNELKKLELKVYPSQANFVLFKSEKALYKPLLSKGILIRNCGNFLGLDETFYRAAIKKHEENISFIQALKEVLRG